MPVLLTVKQKKEYMQLQKKAAALDALMAQKAQRSEYSAWLRQTAEVEQWEMPDPSVYRNQMELYRLVPGVQTAAEMLGKVAKSARYSVKRLVGEEERDIPNHEFEQLLKRPNPLHSRSEFQNAVILSRVLAGNAYIWKNVKDQYSPPDELWYIPVDKILPVPDENMYLSHYLYDAYGAIESGIRLETWEVIHLKRYNPFNVFIGLSALEALAVTALGYKQASEWNLRLFAENNARLPGILAFKDYYNPTDWQALQGQILDSAKKRQLMMLNGVQQGGVEWMKASGSHAEMEFLQGLNVSKETIYDSLAPGLSSMLAINSNEANARVGEAIFRNYGVWPLLEDLSDKYISDVLPLYGPNLTGEFDDIRMSDRAMELQEQEQFAKTHTVDEIRKEYYGHDPIGDERGELLIAEIGGASPFGNQPQEQETEPGNMDDNQQPENTEEEGEQAQKSARVIELERYRTFALKRLGKSIRPFESNHVPQSILDAIHTALPACKSERDVYALFDRYIDDDGAMIVLRGLELAVQGLKGASGER